MHVYLIKNYLGSLWWRMEPIRHIKRLCRVIFRDLQSTEFNDFDIFIGFLISKNWGTNTGRISTQMFQGVQKLITTISQALTGTEGSLLYKLILTNIFLIVRVK